MSKLGDKLKTAYFYFRGKVVAKRMYDEKYLKTSYFSHPSSVGWALAVYDWHARKTTGKNKNVPWPVCPGTDVPHPENIVFAPEDLRIFFGSGIYFQGIDAKTIIGHDVWIAKNVGLITCNHDLHDPNKHMPGKEIVLGDSCWIGMNAMIMPGVILGPHTVVGAGAVVTKSFPEGYCVIAGNPAKLIKKIEET